MFTVNGYQLASYKCYDDAYNANYCKSKFYSCKSDIFFYYSIESLFKVTMKVNIFYTKLNRISNNKGFRKLKKKKNMYFTQN